MVFMLSNIGYVGLMPGKSESKLAEDDEGAKGVK
jgi:hypothetical protein